MLANILLDDLDEELERRGHRFVRYPHDQNVYVRARRAGERVMASVRRFLAERLRLEVNGAKSAVDRPERRTFLGLSFCKRRGEVHVRLSRKAIERVKQRIRGLTGRSRGQTMDTRLQAMNAYLAGWLGYYGQAQTSSVFEELGAWLRHRLRARVWKPWKRPLTRYRELAALGLPAWVARLFAGSGKGVWRMAGGPMNRAPGLVCLSDGYRKRCV